MLNHPVTLQSKADMWNALRSACHKKRPTGCTPFLRSLSHMVTALCWYTGKQRTKMESYQSTVLRFKIKDFSWACWIFKSKSQDLCWFCFLMRGKVLLVKAKKRNWCWKKQKKTRVLNVSCSLVALLRAFLTKTVVVCSQLHEVFRHPSDRFILPKQIQFRFLSLAPSNAI